MVAPHIATNRASALSFIAAQQERPATATAFVGTKNENLLADLDALKQPWMETLRIIENEDGAITGAALVEWDPEVGTAWIYGPWTTTKTWDRDAAVLLDSVVSQAPVNRHQMYGALENTQMAGLAKRLQWLPNDADITFESARKEQAHEDRDVRPARSEDLAELTELHDDAFPGTYATMRQLLETDSEYTTLVLADADGLIGYAAGQPDGDSAYLDFVAVAPSRRRMKAATRLVGALANTLPGDTITLTCSEAQAAAIEFYQSIGWKRGTVSRAYDLRNETSD